MDLIVKGELAWRSALSHTFSAFSAGGDERSAASRAAVPPCVVHVCLPEGTVGGYSYSEGVFPSTPQRFIHTARYRKCKPTSSVIILCVVHS